MADTVAATEAMDIVAATDMAVVGVSDLDLDSAIPGTAATMATRTLMGIHIMAAAITRIPTIPIPTLMPRILPTALLLRSSISTGLLRNSINTDRLRSKGIRNRGIRNS